MDFDDGSNPWDFGDEGPNMFNQQDMTTLNDFFANWEQSKPSSERIIEEFPITKPLPPRLPAPIITEKLHLVNSCFVQSYNNLKKENVLLSAGSEPHSASSNIFSAVSAKPLNMYTVNDSGPQSGKTNTPTPPLSENSYQKTGNPVNLDLASGIGFGPGSGSGKKRAGKVKKEAAPKKQKASPSSEIILPGKGLLTEQEKKHNHVVSEQRRRQAIRDGFDEIVKLTPSLINGPVSAGPGNTGGGHSKSTILNAAAVYILELQEEVMKLKNENFKLKADKKVENIKIDTNHQAIPQPSLLFPQNSSQQSYLNSPTTAYPHHGASFLEENQDQFRGRYGDLLQKNSI